jgi:hypothetical protein
MLASIYLAESGRAAATECGLQKRGEAMYGRRHVLAVASCLFFLAFSGCGGGDQTEVVELRDYPLDNLTGLLTESENIMADADNSVDGNGSLKIVASEPITVALYETGDIDIENAKLTYQAELMTEDLEGEVFLEMWCAFEDKGEYFSRGLDSTVKGTTDWTTLVTPFFLKTGENPDNVKLNLVIDGTGTVWIDDIKLVKGPLE